MVILCWKQDEPCDEIFTFAFFNTSVQNECVSLCMNCTTFHDLKVGGVLVKTCIIAFIKLL